MTLKPIYIAAAALLCACLAATVTTTRAQDADFAERLRTTSAATRSIECDFTLTRTMSIMASDVISEGRFYYLHDAGISLEFTQPAGDLITMGRERFRIVSVGRASTVKVESNPMLRQLQRMLTACMTGDVDMLRQGAELAFADEGATFVVTITPTDRRARGMVRLITLTFEKQNMSLTTLRMEEASGDVSQYRFFDKRFNGEIDPSRFDVR
ncbi:MAG: outer membrane lipoprotein carrier protein LolA [Alistipes sp.]|jgi:outer membrane lipoprotein-sorting protein|nr:outer membrane lipoprotein carrier protein LolA [Alistipes sp.]